VMRAAGLRAARKKTRRAPYGVAKRAELICN
jgi:hypothetical protein